MRSGRSHHCDPSTVPCGGSSVTAGVEQRASPLSEDCAVTFQEQHRLGHVREVCHRVSWHDGRDQGRQTWDGPSRCP
eukprot:7152172-Pyramimonas_sp.AAC.1